MEDFLGDDFLFLEQLLAEPVTIDFNQLAAMVGKAQYKTPECLKGICSNRKMCSERGCFHFHSLFNSFYFKLPISIAIV